MNIAGRNLKVEDIRVLLLILSVALGLLFKSDLTHLQLSLYTLRILNEKMNGTPAYALLVSPIQSTVMTLPCADANSIVDSLNPPTLPKASNLYRLGQLVSLACQSDSKIMQDLYGARWKDLGIVSVLNASEVLERNSKSGDALVLRRSIPQSALWYVNRGRFEIEKVKDESRALQDFKIAEEIAPQFDEHKYGLYMYLCLMSVRENRTFIRPDPCSDFDHVKVTALSRLLLGRSRFNSNEFSLAIEYLNDAIGLDKSSGDAYYWLAKTYQKLGLDSSAETILKNGIARAPDFPWNYLELATTYIRAGCYDSARAHLDKMRNLVSEEAVNTADSLLLTIDGKRGNDAKCQ